MKNIPIKQLKNYLSDKSEKELNEEIITLFKTFPQVKDYFTALLDNGNNGIIAEKYKDIITKEFFPKRGFGRAKLSVAKKAISDFKKLPHSPASLVDIMLHYVEEGSSYTNTYGDIDEPFYTSMEIMYDNALKLVAK